MKMKKTRIVTAVAAALVFHATSARAIIGVGDISFDPTVYGELVEVWTTLQEMYKTTKKQLDNVIEIQRTMDRAYKSYEEMRNFDLKEAYHRATNFRKAGDNARIGERLRVLRGNVDRVGSEVNYDVNFLNSQRKRIMDLERLELVQKASEKNLDHVATDTDPTKAAVVTAQSTAVLAQLATEAAATHTDDAVAKEQAAKTQADVSRDLNLFGAASEAGQ